jgi:hypothetical protein
MMRLLTLAVVFVAALSSSTAEAAAISFFPLPHWPPVVVGGPFELLVRFGSVTNADKVYSFEFDIAFDPTVLQADAPTPSYHFWDSNFSSGVIDNLTGTITGISSRLEVPGDYLLGSGGFATLHFTPVAAGVSPVTFNNLILLHPDLTEVQIHSIRGTTVPVVIPEPSNLLLALCSGSALLWVYTRRTRPIP